MSACVSISYFVLKFQQAYPLNILFSPCPLYIRSANAVRGRIDVNENKYLISTQLKIQNFCKKKNVRLLLALCARELSYLATQQLRSCANNEFFIFQLRYM